MSLSILPVEEFEKFKAVVETPGKVVLDLAHVAETTADILENATVTIAEFDEALHDRNAFSCGFSPIDGFLRSLLSKLIEAGTATAWMATINDDPAVFGFYALSALKVQAEPDSDRRCARFPDIQAIYLRAIAVHKDKQGNGFGSALMIHAMKRCLEIADQKNAAAIVLDVLKPGCFERRRRFYTDLGFRRLGDPNNLHRVHIPMTDIKVTLERT